MSEQTTAQIILREGLHFTAVTAAGHAVELDSPTSSAPAGPAPMEMVLASLASCSAMDVIAILRKKRQPVRGLTVLARGDRADEHPRVYTSIALEYVAYGVGVDPTALSRAVELARDRYCPVWAMLAGSVAISFAIRVVDGDPPEHAGEEAPAGE